NFTIVQGEKVSLNYIIKNANGSVFNLTGYTVSASLIRSYTDPNENPLNFVVTVNSNPTTGNITLSLGSNQTLLLALDNYYYEVMITNGTNTYQILTGLIRVIPGINTRGKYTFIPSDETLSPTMNFIFNTPQSTWTINHNLNTLNIVIVTYDSNGNQIQGSIQLVNLNTATITFVTPQTGTAVVLQ